MATKKRKVTKKTLEGKVPKETLDNASRWHALALAYGYNELAKLAQSLGEKVYCRLARENAEEEYKRLGGVIERTEDAAILVLTEHMPHLKFTARDINLMKAAIAAYEGK